MKFAIAAGILAQTIPTLSKNVDSRISKQNDHRGFDQVVAKAVNGPNGHRRATLMNKSITPRAGRRLKNPRPASTNRHCDPLSSDPDVGLLSCGLGYDCVADQSSTLGGLCTAMSRELQPATCKVCGEYGTIAINKYENPVVVEGVDSITNCQDTYTTAYLGGSIEYSTCTLLTTTLATTADCCTPYCDLCGEGEYVLRANHNLPLTETIDGVDGSTCGAAYFAAYYYVPFTEEECPLAGDVVIASGCCGPVVTTDCSICGDATFYGDNQVTSAGTLYTCLDLQPYLSTEACNLPAYVQVCCNPPEVASPTPTVGATAASGTPTMAPVVAGDPGTMTPVAAPVVPVDTPAPSNATVPEDAGSDIPTMAPVVSPSTIEPIDAAAPSPPSASTIPCWSSTTVVSMMSLSVATAGALMLN